MPYFVGLDASKKTTQICIIGRAGDIVREGAVPTAPKEIAAFLRGERRRYVRVGMESWGMASWLYDGLARAGLPIVCIEGRNAHGILKAQRNKTDRNDARGIANLMRLGAYRKVHIKSASSQEIRAMLTARRLLADKAHDIANSIRGLLLGLGLKLESLRRRTFEPRVRVLLARHDFARSLIEPLLEVHSTIMGRKAEIEARLIAAARADPVCRRLMTAPGIGELTALIFRTAVDEPLRFSKSRALGAHFGMTSRTSQSGDVSYQGRITCWGDGTVRRALVLAAWTQFKRNTRKSWLSDWAAQVAARRGVGKAIVAVARRLAVILHRMWVSETDFRCEAPGLG